MKKYKKEIFAILILILSALLIEACTHTQYSILGTFKNYNENNIPNTSNNDKPDLTGKIFDKITCKPIQFAHIVINLKGSIVGIVSSDSNGFFKEWFKHGIYDLEISADGYSNLAIDNFMIPVVDSAKSKYFLSKTGTVNGIIIDSTSNLVLENVEVTLRDSLSNFIDYTFADSSGFFSIYNIPNGKYKLELIHENYESKEFDFYNYTNISDTNKIYFIFNN